MANGNCIICGQPKIGPKYCRDCSGSKAHKARTRAANIAKGLRCDGVPLQPEKPKQTKAEKNAYMVEWHRKRSAKFRSQGLRHDGTPRKRKVLTPEERRENKKRLQKETYERRGSVYKERAKARRKADPDYNRKHCEQRQKRLADPAKRAAFNKMQNDYRRNRRASDPEFKLLTNMRTLMYIAVSGRCYDPDKIYRKSKSTMKYIGCTIRELREYVEAKFTDGMSWDNYGKWHMDHIVPVSAFDQTNEDDLHKCWHYTNFQPLWGADNISKGGVKRDQ